MAVLTAIHVVALIAQNCTVRICPTADPVGLVRIIGVTFIAGNAGGATLQIVTVTNFAGVVIIIFRPQERRVRFIATALFPARFVRKIDMAFIAGNARSSTLQIVAVAIFTTRHIVTLSAQLSAMAAFAGKPAIFVRIIDMAFIAGNFC